MAKGSNPYLKEIYERTTYFAAWFPNSKLTLGDIGINKGGEFKRMAQIEDLVDIPFETRTSSQGIDFTYTSKSGMNMITKLKGQLAPGTTLPLDLAGISIEFSKEGAFLLKASGCKVDEIENKIVMGQAILNLYKKGDWDPEWEIIDTIVRAKSATILISVTKNALLELTAKTPVAMENIAKSETGLKVISEKGEVISFIAEKGLTPLFKLSRVKKSFFSNVIGKPLTFGGPSSDILEEDIFEVVRPQY